MEVCLYFFTRTQFLAENVFFSLLLSLWKEKQLEYYANDPVTQKQYPVLDSLTRLKLRNEWLEKQFKEKKH